MHTNKSIYIASFFLIWLVVLLPTVPVQAQAGSGVVLINTENAYRPQYDLEAYQIDDEFINLAQNHLGIIGYRPPTSQDTTADQTLPGNEPVDSQTDPNPPISPIITSTPNEDGSIAHVVQYGDTLITIAEAYGMPLSELISMNKLDPNSPAIFEGQPLLIRVAFTATPFITTTFTPRPPTRTPLPTRTPRPTRTATPILSPTSTRTMTREPLIQFPTLEQIEPTRPVLAYVAFGVAFIALIALVISAFWPYQRK